MASYLFMFRFRIARRKVFAALGACMSGTGAAATASGGSPAASPQAVTGEAARAPVLLAGRAPCAAGAAFRCARLRVPLERAPMTSGAPARARLTLQVAVERGARPRKGYLVVLTGGPGEPGLPFADAVRSRLRAAAAGYRLVLLDQRGTGAGALRCTPLQRSVGDSDVAVAARGSVEACSRRLRARRAAFTTNDTVADLEDLRRALRADRLALLGISYGSFVAERYALTHPLRVRRLILDSVVPQSGADALLVSSMAAVPRVLHRACSRVGCRADVGADLRAALARGVDGVALLDTLVALSAGPARLERVLPALHAAALGRPEALVRLATAIETEQAAVPVAAFSAGLHAATLCAEADVPWHDATTTPADREQALAQARAKLTPGRLGGFEPATAVGNGLADTCRRWAALPQPVPAPTGALPDIPTLGLAGELDLVTPLEDARSQLKRAPGGQLLEVPGVGHSVVLRDPGSCAIRALGRFLAGRAAPARCA